MHIWTRSRDMALVRIVSDIRHTPRSQSPTQLTVIRLSGGGTGSRKRFETPGKPENTSPFLQSISTDMSLYHEVSMLSGCTLDSYKTNWTFIPRDRGRLVWPSRPFT